MPIWHLKLAKFQLQYDVAMKKSKDGKPDKLGKDDYYERLAPLQLELNDLARWLQFTGKRLMVVIEGRDTAGKGGVIAAIADTLNPRQCRTVALAKPSEREQTQWYFQRYVPHLPAAGEMVLFDRSWYNRAGVERVMGFCTEDQHDLAHGAVDASAPQQPGAHLGAQERVARCGDQAAIRDRGRPSGGTSPSRP